MSDNAATTDDASVTFHVKSSGNQKYTLTLPLSTTTIDLKNKLSGEEYANVPASAQRLIYSGKVLKDHETLASYNVKEGNTMHLVKSAPSNQRQNPAGQSNSTPAAGTPGSAPAPTGVPQNLASGTGNDPLAGLTGARFAGFHGLPSMESLANPPSPDEMLRRLQDPNFAQQMNEALQNPQMIDMMINMNPQLRQMGPQARQILQSEQFRRMMTNPDALRSMMEMQNAMGGSPFGGMGGQEAFPMPGATNTTDQQHQGQDQNQQQNQANPFANLFGPGAGAGAGAGANPFLFNPAFQPPQTQNNSSDPSSPPTNQQQSNQANPFAALFNPAMFQPPGQQQGQQQGENTNTNTSTNTNDPSSQPPNPFAGNPYMQNMYNSPFIQNLANNPEAMRNMMQMLGGGGAGGAGGMDPMGLFGGSGGGFGQPADNRPPEERYATQLRQLNEMGFFNYDQNIQALTRSGGDVNGALEWLFSQPQGS